MLKRHRLWLVLAIVFLFLTALIQASSVLPQSATFNFSIFTALICISLHAAYLLTPKQVRVIRKS